MHIGFSGSRNINAAQEKIVIDRLESITHTISVAITGACTGVDAAIALHVTKHMKHVRNVIVVPSYRDHVDPRVLNLDSAMYFHMPIKSTYRDRNEKIVELAMIVDIFFNGQFASGTWMTRNIAFKAGKLGEVIAMPYRGLQMPAGKR